MWGGSRYVPSRVVITGLGVVSPIGIGVSEFWKSALAGRSGVSAIRSFDPFPLESYRSKIAGQIRDFSPEQYLPPNQADRVDRYAQFALIAVKEALADADLVMKKEAPHRVGVIVGAGMGGMVMGEREITQLYQQQKPHRVHPNFIPVITLNSASGIVAMAYGAKGPNLTISTACSSSAHALGQALHTIRSGQADVMITGGTEAAVTRIGLAGFCSMKALSTRNDEPTRASRPFDRDRDGFVLGEGAAMVVLEEESHARRRGATIHGEVIGYGSTADAFRITDTHPEGRGAASCLQMALADAQVRPDQIQYINAHGTSTDVNDRVETLAIKKVFGEHAYRVPVSSTKSMMGHLIAAAGATELIICLLAIRDNVLPPTINYETPDPDCDLDYVPNQAREARCDVAASNSFGFGGQNITLIVRRFAG